VERVAVIAVSDLMFQPRITAVAMALGLRVRIADSAETAREAIAEAPAVVVVDLQERNADVTEIIVAAKAAGARVLAFGRHTDGAVLQAARRAGADTVVARSELAEDLPRLLGALLPAASA